MNITVNESALLQLLNKEIKENNSYIDILYLFSSQVYELSKIYCPYDTGNLKNSSKIEVFNNKISISYNTNYATYVHEIITNNHKIPTKSKFLEYAFNEVYKSFDNSIIDIKYSMYYGLDKLEMVIYI